MFPLPSTPSSSLPGSHLGVVPFGVHGEYVGRELIEGRGEHHACIERESPTTEVVGMVWHHKMEVVLVAVTQENVLAKKE